MSEGAKRYDQGKTRWMLNAWDAMREVGKVSTMGSQKYGARNWEKGMLYSRMADSMIRHFDAWWHGEQHDPESGLPHMAHCAWNALGLLAFELRGIGDRLVKDPDTGAMVPADDRPCRNTIPPPRETQRDTNPSCDDLNDSLFVGDG